MSYRAKRIKVGRKQYVRTVISLANSPIIADEISYWERRAVSLHAKARLVLIWTSL